MIYSFKKPQQKPLLNKLNKLCFNVFIGIISIILIFAVYIKFKQESTYKESMEAKIKSDQVIENIQSIKSDLVLNKQYVELANDIKASNVNLKKSIQNLFDLIPDSIILSEVLMEQKSLLIKGKTPTKDIYNNLLFTPLQSIFETSRTNFIQLESGWYNFTSINTIENSEGFNE